MVFYITAGEMSIITAVGRADHFVARRGKHNRTSDSGKAIDTAIDKIDA